MLALRGMKAGKCPDGLRKSHARNANCDGLAFATFRVVIRTFRPEILCAYRQFGVPHCIEKVRYMTYVLVVWFLRRNIVHVDVKVTSESLNIVPIFFFNQAHELFQRNEKPLCSYAWKVFSKLNTFLFSTWIILWHYTLRILRWKKHYHSPLSLLVIHSWHSKWKHICLLVCMSVVCAQPESTVLIRHTF